MHLSTRLSDHVEIGAVRRDLDDGLEVVTTDGGWEVRNDRWAQPLLAFDISFPTSERDDPVFLEVRGAYRATRRGAHSFRFKDWSDFTAADEAIGTGNGATTAFPLVKNYSFGAETFVRRIQQPVSPITVKRAGVVQNAGYSVNYATGVVTFAVAPAPGEAISWSGEFDVPVRFASPLESTGIATHLEHHEAITLVEVRI
ncbi:MAG TPA: DUF2460 domain-containing protein [Sphingomicrobium sp.]|nr:DUF2460 domain-containing protein [Sphingomicrobium sp.]